MTAERWVTRNDVPGGPVVLYVVDQAGDATGMGSAATVGLWTQIFDDAYRKPPSKTDFDIAGWHSRVRARPFSPTEMAQWLDDTVARLSPLPARHVLEIGCGTGLLLWRLLGGCDSYVGVDISVTAVDRLRVALREDGAGHATVVCGEAVDAVDYVQREIDLVLINSVVQYFPGEHYLVRVLDRALSVLAPGGCIFIGDIRNADLLDALHLTVVGTMPQATERRQRLRQAVATEPELLVSPLWFARYAQQRGLTVRAMPKLGRIANELNDYRFDVVLSRDGGFEEIRFEPWRGRQALAAAVCSGRRVGFRAVPHPGVTDAADEAHRILFGRPGPVPVREEGVRPAELSSPFQVSLLGGTEAGTYDLVVGPSAERVQMPVRVDGRARPATTPWIPGSVPAVQPAVQAARTLPPHQRPVAVVAVTDLEGALPRPWGLEALDVFAPPRTDTERRLAQIWHDLLGVAPIGTTDTFLRLGGTAQIACETVRRAAAGGIHMDEQDLLAGLTLAEVAFPGRKPGQWI